MKSLLRPLFRRLYYLLYRNGKTVSINNERYKVSAHIARGVNKNMDEPPYNILERLCKDANTVFDIGASNGIVSLLLSKHMGKGSVIHSFEPTPATYKILSDNARVQDGNSLIKPHNLAVGSSNSLIHFMQVDRKTMNYVVREETADTIDVKCVMLDSFCNENGIRPEVIKIDVEGWEYNVLFGALELLKSGNITLLIEMHQDILRSNGIMPDQFNELIKSTGYLSYGKDGNLLSSPFDADWVLVLSKKELPQSIFNQKSPT